MAEVTSSGTVALIVFALVLFWVVSLFLLLHVLSFVEKWAERQDRR